MISLNLLLDIGGSLFGIGYLFGIAKKNRLAWPLGILSCIFFAILCLNESWIIQALIQGMYAVLGIWGWYTWKKDLIPRKIPQSNLVLISILLVVFVVFYFSKNRYTVIEIIDAFCLVFSIVSTVLTIFMFQESWYFWIVVNGATAWIAFERNLTIFFCLSILYFLLSIYGKVQWKKS